MFTVLSSCFLGCLNIGDISYRCMCIFNWRYNGKCKPLDTKLNFKICKMS